MASRRWGWHDGLATLTTVMALAPAKHRDYARRLWLGKCRAMLMARLGFFSAEHFWLDLIPPKRVQSMRVWRPDWVAPDLGPSLCYDRPGLGSKRGLNVLAKERTPLQPKAKTSSR